MTIIKKTLTAAAIALGLAGFGCDVEQTREGTAPELDFDYKPGEAPEYDVDTAEVEVGTEVEQVRVPRIDIIGPDEQEANERE